MCSFFNKEIHERARPANKIIYINCLMPFRLGDGTLYDIMEQTRCTLERAPPGITLGGW